MFSRDGIVRLFTIPNYKDLDKNKPMTGYLMGESLYFRRGENEDGQTEFIDFESGPFISIGEVLFNQFEIVDIGENLETACEFLPEDFVVVSVKVIKKPSC